MNLEYLADFTTLEILMLLFINDNEKWQESAKELVNTLFEKYTANILKQFKIRMNKVVQAKENISVLTL